MRAKYGALLVAFLFVLTPGLSACDSIMETMGWQMQSPSPK